MKNKLGFALLGCGRIAHKHAGIFRDGLPNARLVAACDLNPERATEFADKYNVPVFGSLSEMLDRAGGEIDVVNVLTPPGYHLQNVLDLVPHKKHIVLEKPMALSLGDSEAIIDQCRRAGVKLFVVKQNRFNTPVQKLHEAIHSGRLGKILLATATVHWTRHQAYFDGDLWRGTEQLDGGIFANQAVHHLDLLSWLVGDIETVFAHTSRNLLDIQTEDTGIAMFRFRSGALGMITATVATRPKDLGASISILGERGTVEIGGFAVNELKTWQFEEERTSDVEVLTKYRSNPADVFAYPHREYLTNVIDSIVNDTATAVDGVEALKSVRIVNAIYESAKLGTTVTLPEVGEDMLVPQQQRGYRGYPEPRLTGAE